MKVVLLAGLVAGLLAGCARKATPCDSEYMRGKMKAAFVEYVTQGYWNTGVDLFAAGLVSNVRYDNIETASVGRNGDASLCQATLRFEVGGETVEGEVPYLVVKQSGEDRFRIHGRWPTERMGALLMAGPMGELREKEQEVRRLRFGLSPEERVALGASRERKLAAAEAELERTRERVRNGSAPPGAASNR